MSNRTRHMHNDWNNIEQLSPEMFRNDKVQDARKRLHEMDNPQRLHEGFAVLHGVAFREVIREETAATRTPPPDKYASWKDIANMNNPHDGYDDSTDLLCDPPLCQGGQGKSDEDVLAHGNALNWLAFGLVIVVAMVFGWMAFGGK
jgi:hypothetical protein